MPLSDWLSPTTNTNRFRLVVFTAAGFFVVQSLTKFLRSYHGWLKSPLRKMPWMTKGRSYLFGMWLDIQKEAFMEPHKRWLKAAGWEKNKLPLIFYHTLFGMPSVLVLDCDIVKEILSAPSSSNDTRFPKRLNILKPTIGDGLVTLDGEDWSRHRRIIQPSFQVSVLRDALDQRVWPTVSVLIEAWQRASDREIDLSSHLSAATLDIIGHVAFLHDFKAMDVVTAWSHDASQDRVGEFKDPFISSMNAALNPDPARIALSLMGLHRLYGMFKPEARNLTLHLNEAVDKIIADNLKDDKHTSAPKSLLHLLFNATDTEDNRKFSHVELRDEAKTFLFAGHETTSTWCYWACYALAKHPDVQERVFRDVAAVRSAGRVGVEDVAKMKFLNAFLQEALRLYAPVGIIGRHAARGEELGGFDIPAGTRIVLAPHLLHRHPRYWDSPETFSPERWLQNSAIPGGRLHHFAFIPFSAGGRNCIGQRFATIEAQLLMAPIVRAFQIEVAPSQAETEFKFTNFVTMKAKPGLKICAKPRK